MDDVRSPSKHLQGDKQKEKDTNCLRSKRHVVETDYKKTMYLLDIS